jgi:hypothetical protein
MTWQQCEESTERNFGKRLLTESYKSHSTGLQNARLQSDSGVEVTAAIIRHAEPLASWHSACKGLIHAT